MAEDSWSVAGRRFVSRLIVGTGRYPSPEVAARAIRASGAQIITFAVRRASADSADKLTDLLPPEDFVYLPNTAGCATAEEAARALRLAREMGGSDLVKLEVIGDPDSLMPDMLETLRACEMLAKEGFAVMAYATDDPLMARRLEEAGAAAVMPLGSPIGSGMGILNPYAIGQIVDRAKVPVLVDAGLGLASHVAQAMELGCDAVLANSAIARAGDPVAMGQAMGLAARAGRASFLARPPEASGMARASSPKGV